MPRRSIHRVVWACLCALLMGTACAARVPAATSNTVVSVTVPSATNLNPALCATNLPGVTSLGTVLPGTSTTSTGDCSIVFGSSNDVAMLRLSQQDQAGTAMETRSWGSRASGTALTLYSMAFSSATTGWIGGDSGLLRKTTDGTTWTNVAAGAPGHIYAIGMASPSVFWIAGENGFLRKTTDGGTTFAAQTSTTGLDHIWAIAAIDPSTAWLVADNGKIRFTSDGVTWVTQASGTSNDLIDVAAADATHAVVVGDLGVVRYTTNGATWNAGASGTGQNLTGVTSLGGGVYVAVGAGGTIIRSTDYGATWTARASGTTNALTDVTFVSASNQVFAVGAAGTIVRSIDAGLTWTPVNSGVTTQLNAVTGVGGQPFTDGAGGKLLADAVQGTTPDYGGANNWTTAGAALFGACLRSVTGGAATDGTTWAADVGDADCLDGDGDPWKPIVATPATAGSKVATASNTTTGQANLRFGFRAATNQPPGDYLAELAIEVVAPAT